MNKKELIKLIAKGAGLNLKVTSEYLNVFMESILVGIISEGKVKINGFGTFLISQRKERMGVNPKTLKPISIGASKTIHFRCSKKLKSNVNK